MSDDLIALHGREAKQMPYLHLPDQSGSSRILKAMNRKYDADQYVRVIEALRAARPDIALSSDFIVGFPGERERDFEETMALVRTIGFASAFSFRYSPRPGTPAAAMHGQIAEDVKSERLHRLQELLSAQQRAFNEQQIGAVLPVLVAQRGRMQGQVQGRSPYLQAVHFDGEAGVIGDVVRVRIDGASQNSLSARVDALEAA
jgi:tRNA-2-methylthio-N6-dimethylallyladenosine synthase